MKASALTISKNPTKFEQEAHMLSTIVHSQTSQKISYMHLIIKPHSGVKRNIKYGNDHHPHPLPDTFPEGL